MTPYEFETADWTTLDEILDSGARFDFRFRTHMTNILGFRALLADPALKLLTREKVVYKEIVAGSIQALQVECLARHRTLSLLCGPNNQP